MRNFSLDKAIPQFAAAIEAQIDCDDASDDFIKEKPHSNIRSSSSDWMTKTFAFSIGLRMHRGGAQQILAPEVRIEESQSHTRSGGGLLLDITDVLSDWTRVDRD
jgi:hypothetical protein